jgi:hypothetical protein
MYVITGHHVYNYCRWRWLKECFRAGDAKLEGCASVQCMATISGNKNLVLRFLHWWLWRYSSSVSIRFLQIFSKCYYTNSVEFTNSSRFTVLEYDSNVFVWFVIEMRPPLWSSGQGSWLQIQRSGFDSRHYQIFWEVVRLDRLCGIVLTVPGYRSRGPVSIPGATRFF